MLISYNWLKWYIPEVPEAEKLADIFNHHLCEMESLEKKPDGDTIFDLKVLPNRAHDLLSHQGVARELASLLNIKFVDPRLLPEGGQAASKYKIPSPPAGGGVPDGRGGLKIDVQSEKCRRYIGRIVRNVKVGPSPEWMVKHLESIGQRSINNLVDAANLAMFDCGQPTHIFDLNKVNGGLVIRQAENEESLTTLDDRYCKLNNSNMIIADGKNVLAIAGIKGGKIAEVDNSTKDVILEVANFDPVSIRKTAQALNIITDAKKRFENDLSPELCSSAIRELSSLIYEMCPEAIFEDIVDIYPKKQEARKLSFSADKISKILGLVVSGDEIRDILERYKIEYRPLPNLPLNKREEKGGGLEITVPSMRLDLVIEEDMAEEIGRIMGYDKIKPELPAINFQPKQNEIYLKILSARNKLLAEGYSEVMNSSFSDNGEVEVLASASDKNFLRTNLADGLKESLKLNQINAPLLGMNEIKIFEVGTVFSAKGGSASGGKKGVSPSAQGFGGTKEEMRVAYGDKKGIKEMTLEEFYSPLEEYPLGGGGYPPRLASEPPLKRGISPRPDGHRDIPQEGNHFKMWSLFPFIARDVAVWVPENIKSEEVAKVIKENTGEMVMRGPELFDEFKKLAPPEMGGGMRISYAFRLVFQSYDRTLTDAEVNEIMNKINQKIKENDDWQVR